MFNEARKPTELLEIATGGAAAAAGAGLLLDEGL